MGRVWRACPGLCEGPRARAAQVTTPPLDPVIPACRTCAPSGAGDQACCAGLSPGAADTPCDPSHARSAVCLSASRRSVLLSGTPHTVKYAARKRRVPAALCPAANAPSSHGVRPPSSAPFAAAPVSGHVQRPARQNDALPLADPSRPVQRRMRHPFNPLSEEKAENPIPSPLFWPRYWSRRHAAR
jgi:hypothetical protein